MKKKLVSFFTACILCMSSFSHVNFVGAEEAKVIAFPGAEGGGMYASGGRGGDVYVVTTLEDYIPLEEEPIEGSLRHALSGDNRTIVFNVSGNIHLKKRLDVKGRRNITIAGQTAPGNGITVTGYDTDFSASKNIIVRYIRFRTGSKNRFAGDSMDAVWGRDMNTAIFDHISSSWSTDETMPLYRSSDLTVQWSITSESLAMSGHTKGKHGYGAIWSGLNSTFHHNLVASHISRTPRVSGGYGGYPRSEEDPGLTGIEDKDHISVSDVRNNVIYNSGEYAMYGGGWGRTNVVNNYIKPGPITPKRRLENIFNIGETYDLKDENGNVIKDENGNKVKGYKICNYYFSGNVLLNRDGTVNTKVTNNNAAGIIDSTVKNTPAIGSIPYENKDTFITVVDTPFTTDVLEPDTSFEKGTSFESIVNTQSAEDAYELVLKRAGAVFPRRDAYDARIVDEVRKGIGRSIDREYQVGGLPFTEEIKRDDSFDSDKDGIADAWEIENGLDPTNPDDSKELAADGSGYTNLEKYINSLVSIDYEPENPKIDLNYPSDNAIFDLGEEFTISANITDNDGISKVELYNNDKVMGSITEAPYEFKMKDLEDGTYYFSLKATDGDGNQTQSNVIRVHVNTPNNSKYWKNIDLNINSGTEQQNTGTVMQTTTIPGNFHVNSDGSLTIKGQGTYLAQGKKWEVGHFAYQEITGDCEIEAKLSSITDIDNDAFAGLMIRNSTKYGDRSFNMGLTWTKSESDFAGSGTGRAFQVVSGARLVPSTPGNDAKVEKKNNIAFRQYDDTLGQYLKINRTGNVFTAYYSEDGVTWTKLNEKTIEMDEKVLVGFVADSNQQENEFYSLNTSLFTDVKITGEGAGLDDISGPEPTKDFYGDVNGTGKVDFDDASLVLQYILNNDALDNINDEWLKKANVTGNEEVSALDAAYILKRALDGKFKFPMENKTEQTSETVNNSEEK